MSIKGIKKRWTVNTLWISCGIFTSIMILLAFLVRGYFYNSVNQEIYGRAEEFSKFFCGSSDNSDINFGKFVVSYIENYQNDNNLQIAVCDEKDKLIAASNGPWRINYSFFRGQNAKNPDSKTDIWEEYTPSNQHIITATRNLFDSSGAYLGSVKYIALMEQCDMWISFSILIFFILGIITIGFITFFGLSFINSIIIPIMEISKIAKLIARGNFSIKINKKYNDEIGELCDTINYMAEELGNAEKIKNDFISSVSHEIRTPLTAIKGWAETMNIDEEIDKSVLRKGMDIIVHETERLSKIVEELLDFSRLQNGTMAVCMDKIDILAELGEAVYMFKERAATEKKTLVYNEPKMLSPVLGDRNRLKQVFINVIDNALKYTSEGGGVSVNVSEKDGKICVSVTDNGCGIPKIHLSRVTEKFYKANSSQRGSGIGLAIVSEIIEIHAGTLEIISEENFGTTVNIFLPVIKQVKVESLEDSMGGKEQ